MFFLPARRTLQGAKAIILKGQRRLRGEAAGGLLLLAAAGLALLLANSPLYGLYEAFIHWPLIAGAGAGHLTISLLVNDGLMTLFFLAAGVEIRREIESGLLSEPKQALLPLVAAAGGVCLPALIYLGLNVQTPFAPGWAVPTATDIAFAVGILALLGQKVAAQLRVILLSIALIDDIIAVLIIAFCYSSGLNAAGAGLAAAAIAALALLSRLGVSSLFFYAAGAAALWLGLWQAGIHPSLAGIILGLLIPVQSPAQSGQKALQAWVALAIMPLFAFVNAGIRLENVDFSAAGAPFIFFGVAGGLFIGKPLGVFWASFLAVKSGLCRLPPSIGWGGMALVSLLAGIGFTMALFIAMLAFADPAALAMAILAILCGSALSAALGLGYGLFYRQTLLHQRRRREKAGFLPKKPPQAG